MVYTIIQNVAPTVEPVTKAEVRNQVRADNIASEDDKIDGFIVSARKFLEDKLNRAFLQTQYRMVLDEFPQSVIKLARNPVVSVESIEYLDSSDVVQTVPSAVYGVNSWGMPGSVYLRNGQSWPTDLRVEGEGSVRINFTASAETAAANVDQRVRQWILIAAGRQYDSPDEDVFAKMPRAYLWSLKVPVYNREQGQR